MRDTNSPFLKPASLWFGIAAPSVTWFVHFALVWAVVEMGCRVGLEQAAIFGVNAGHALLLGLSAAAIAITVFAGLSAYRNYRQLSRMQTQEQTYALARAVERSRFMTMAGMSFSVLFLLIIVYVTLPVFTLPLCDI